MQNQKPQTRNSELLNSEPKNRIGTIAILIEDRGQVKRINDLLTEFGHVIIGRIGLPYRERGISIISVIVEGTGDEVGALSGKLGMLQGVRTKALLLTK